MKLYSNSVPKFREDVENNQIGDILAGAFFQHFNHRVSPGEYRSWENSVRILKDSLGKFNSNDNFIALEHEIPYQANRIDALLYGYDQEKKPNIVVVELKQWDKVGPAEVENNVLTWVGGAVREVPHPSLQVLGYKQMLEDLYSTVEEKPIISLFPCVYSHNYQVVTGEQDLLRSSVDPDILQQAPVFEKHEVSELGKFLEDRLSGGMGEIVFNRFSNSPIKPSKRLIEEFASMRKTSKDFQSRFVLVDDQIAVRNAIVHSVKKITKSKKKSVVIIDGGPGTGKSVIALESMTELMKMGKVVFYSTGGGAITKTMKKIAGNRAKQFFTYFYSHTQRKENELDVVICDEAHRMKRHSNDYGVPYQYKSKNPQVEDIIRSAKVSVFLLDEMQVIRPNEVGDLESIRTAARKYGAEIHEYQLKSQFRCSGSDEYLQWVENLLGLRESDYSILSKDEPMQFEIVDSPEEMKRIIDGKNDLKTNSARIVAGYCWPWSDPILESGELVSDVTIGSFTMPWEAKWGKKHSKAVPDAEFWATDPKGISQIGTVYTSQGFEFDYIGIIWAEDLVYRKEQGGWLGQPDKSFDKGLKRKNVEFEKYIKRIYRVLMSRAHFGVYVYVMDRETREYISSLIEK